MANYLTLLYFTFQRHFGIHHSRYLHTIQCPALLKNGLCTFKCTKLTTMLDHLKSVHHAMQDTLNTVKQQLNEKIEDALISLPALLSRYSSEVFPKRHVLPKYLLGTPSNEPWPWDGSNFTHRALDLCPPGAYHSQLKHEELKKTQRTSKT